MKKLILPILFVLASFSSLSAQELKLGLKAGMNFSKVKTNDELFNQENNQGYLVGAWGRVGSSSIFLQPEAYFTSKHIGLNPEAEDAATDLVNGDLKFSNIDVPILLGTKFPIGPFKARLMAGPLFSFVIDSEAKMKDNINGTLTSDNLLNSYKDKFSAVVGGVGFDIFKFTVDLRYEYGLGNFQKEEVNKQTLNVWTVGVGFSFF